jgi:MoaA/NifB/PqqE/SkfB family radical SAM enzyme
VEIWMKNLVLQDLRQGLPQRLDGICGHCLLKKICLGKCLAQNYYRSKSLWDPFWFCQQAYERGLFPDTRVIPDGVMAGSAALTGT